MSFFDDLRECKYTAPSGKTMTLQFDEVDRELEPKVAINDPPQQNRSEVQHLGFRGIRYPMTVYFSGPDFHTQADAFFLLMAEPTSSSDPGTLQHPRWGDILVALIGPLTHHEGWVENVGMASFGVEWIRVDRTAKFPATANDAGAQLQADIEAAAEAGTGAYTENGTPTTPGDIATVTAKSTDLFTAIGDSLRGMASSAEDLGAQFEADLATALGSVDALVADPVTLAEAVMSLARAPAQAVIAIGDKVREYQTLVDTIGTTTAASYAEAELVLLALCGGCAGASEATLSGDLGTRSDAVESADLIGDITDAMRLALERAQADLGWAPDADTVAKLEDMLSTARARLLDASFSLKVERHYVTSGPIDPISLMRQLTGGFTDEALDQAVKDNDLSDEEFFLLPPGFDWVWYA